MKWNAAWIVPALTVYAYAVTILTYTGYTGYFNIPSSYVEGSISSNIQYVYFLAQILAGMLQTMRWYDWLALIFVFLTLLGTSFFFLLKRSTVFGGLVVFLLLVFLWQSPNFGTFLAKNQTIFFAPEAGCLNEKPEQRYLVATFYGDTAVLVSVDAKNHLQEGFITRDISALPCRIAYNYIVGKIVK